MNSASNNKCLILLYILLTAVIVLYWCAESSPLYLTNFWTDANVYFTIGRGMREGLVPYVDLYDHKGPVIYFMHMLAAYVTTKSFFGVYCLEIIASFCFLSLSYKTLQLYCGQRSLAYIPWLALIVYTSNTFVAGDSAEELCLPALMLAFYLGCKAIKNDDLPDSKGAIIVGICMAYVFWLKFTMVGFFIGFAVAMLFYSVSKSLLCQYWRLVGYCLGGFVSASLLIMFYFASKHGLQQLFQVYICDNIFTYNRASNIFSSLRNLKDGIFSYTYYFTYGMLFSLLGWHYLFNHTPKGTVQLSMWTFLGLFVTSFMGGRYYNYYNFVFSIYMPLAFAWVDSAGKKYLERYFKVCLLLGIGVCFLACPLSYNKGCRSITAKTYYLEDYAQVIRQVEKPTMINYGVMDLGLYNYCNIVPQYRYFSMTNIREPHMLEGVKNYIIEQKPDFIFALGGVALDGYQCVVKKEYNDYGEKIFLCLYKRVR